MDWMQALFLGLVQGLTEFLPISSTAHLRVVPHKLPGRLPQELCRSESWDWDSRTGSKQKPVRCGSSELP